MIYLDACALVKLIREEEGSAALRAFLDEYREVDHVTSELAGTELVRVVRRANHDDQERLTVDQEAFDLQLREARDVFDAVSKVVLDTDVLDRAGAIESSHLGTLDAIQLASALGLEDALTSFVTYDKTLRKVATGVGVRVESPS
ncbi:MAG: type II toxin-antitoxin system VapC family toxin [Streptosporangiaceae bacterium]